MLRTLVTSTLVAGLMSLLFVAAPSASAASGDPAPVPGSLYAATVDLSGKNNGDVVANRRFSSPLYPGADIWQIPIGALRDTAARYCASGATLQFDVVHASQHIQAAFEGLPAALTFLDNRFRGIAPPNNCLR